jgi:hypothetical protein
MSSTNGEMPPNIVGMPYGAKNGSVYAIANANKLIADNQLSNLLQTNKGGALRKKGGAITVQPLQIPYPGSTLPDTNVQLTKLFAVSAANSVGDSAWNQKAGSKRSTKRSSKRRSTRSSRRSTKQNSRSTKRSNKQSNKQNRRSTKRR